MKLKSQNVIFLIFQCVFVLMITAPSMCGEFEKATPGKTITFPRDHGKHKGFETEWWYFTGNLISKNRHWGTQLTFFRRGLMRKSNQNTSAWEVSDLYPAHFAITNITDNKFFHTELISREGPGLSGAATEHLNVHVKNWSASQEGEKILVKARDRQYAIALTLTPEKPAVLHGNKGFSVKGSDKDQASYYYSFTRLKADGTILFDGREHRVSGLMWMDHEFGSSILKPDQAGWDWFSIQLDNKTELMAFHLRRKDGSSDKPFATFVDSSGNSTHLSGESVIIKAVNFWVSPHTKASYPLEWVIEVPEKQLKIRIIPAIKDQELTTEKTAGTTYWEGAVTVSGISENQPVKGSGYVELTGYASSMGGKL
ncbi:MAG: carotenoid 1,2-hydratase [Deltaproteobacteria bacterium]|nr:carotenoid 1,2-hydratase [Deltaproteobacteria bacterium]